MEEVWLTFDLHAVDGGDGGELLFEVFDVPADFRLLQVGYDGRQFSGLAFDAFALCGSQLEVVMPSCCETHHLVVL